MVVVGNGLAGLWALGTHRAPALRRRELWWSTVAVELCIFVQVGLGVVLVAAEGLEAPGFHDFYGYVALISVGIAYSYRTTSPWVRHNRYLFYGLCGLFLMGLGIRAMILR